MKTHYTASELLSPQHPVTVTLVGVGGTGSHVLNNLARLHTTLNAIGHPGLHVTAYDSDIVTEANMGRQLFSPAEVGMNKAVALISRINRFFGLQWNAKPYQYKAQSNTCNILITCVDNVSIRKEIGKGYGISDIRHNASSENQNYYWMDFGNSRTSGQIVLGTYGAIQQPKKVKNTECLLPTITKLFPDLQKHEDKDNTPSCSLAEAITKQDLFINSILAHYGCNMLWKMFREAKINYHGLFVNLETMSTNPIKLK